MITIPNPRPAAHGNNPVELTDGRIAVCWFAGTREGVEDQRVLVSASDDGTVWDEPRVLVDHFEHDGDRWVPEIAALLHEPTDGSLWVVFSAAPLSGFSYRPGSDAWLRSLERARLFQAPVSEPGFTMGEPAEVASRLPLILQGKPVAVPGARWLIQCNARDDEGRFAAALLEGTPRSGWTETRHLTALPGCLEPSTAYFTDGEVLTYLRYAGHGGHIWRSESAQGTSGLCDPFPTTLRNPNSGIDIAVGEHDELVLVYNDSYRLRTPLTLCVSFDRGVTFRCRDIETEPGEYSYPKLFRHASGSWFVFYTRLRKHIACLPFDIRDLRSGRPVVGLDATSTPAGTPAQRTGADAAPGRIP